VNYVWATASDVGLQRDTNEDSVHPHGAGTSQGPLLVIVADGMGGHAAGDVASRIAVETAVALDEASPQDRVTAANTAVVDAADVDPALAGMGTTMSLAHFDGSNRVVLAHVGDSRIYLYRGGDLSQVTRDHTYVAELLAAGRIDADEAASHPLRHMITRALGTARSVDVDRRSGDRLLLCSDGLTSMVDDDGIAAILESADDPAAAVWDLVEAANGAGGVDNITVAVVDITP
jgi:PPM family protein phosphatase